MKISLFIIPTALITSYFGFFDEYIVMFLALLFHEAGHLLAVKKNYLEISFIKIEPFGMRIALKDELIENPYDEIKIAAAGPVMSLLISFICFLIFNFTDMFHIQYFAACNLYIGLFNLLPAFPADGGRILRAFLSLKTGYIKSYNAVRKITLAVSLCMIVSGIIILMKTRFNFSLCLTGAFLYFGILTEKNYASYFLNKELSEYKTKPESIEGINVSRIAVGKDYPVRKILTELTFGKYLIAEVIDGYKKSFEFTEGELMEQMLLKGADITIKDIYKR